VRENRKSLRRSIEWLSAGGLLVVFPAGEVASMQLPELGIKDPQWTENVARLMLRTGASAVPVFFHGTNSPIFHLAGLLHPSLRTMLLPHELLNKAGTEIPVSIGKPIRADRLTRIPGFRDATDYLRARTYLLEGRSQLTPAPMLFPNPGGWRKPAALAVAQDSSDIEREIAGLPTERHLVVAGEYLVCVATAEQIPATLLELGRLREVTFRAVGEGTGNTRDLDAFDRHYEHLLVWNREKREVAGAYRLARTDEILKSIGRRGLYTSTLFHLHPNFYEAVGPAIELGRSFVRAEYQKSYQPLLLLWKGLGHYVAANPQYRILFGPVSISKDYTPSSRTLMAEYLKSQSGSQDLAAYIKPRKPFRTHGLSGCDPRTFGTLVSNLEDLSELVAELEGDHKGIPILLQQYLKLGGQVLEFSVDQKFSNVLDGLIVVDLAKASPSKLERYMGKDNARNFLAHHAPHA
jgi:putative hemolysin